MSGRGKNEDETRRESGGTPVRADGLGLLWADVLATGAEDRETLVQYADAPESLAPEARRAFEAKLDAEPAWRDRVSVLRNFDPLAASEEDLTDADENVVPLSAGRRRAWVPWIGVAAAAGLMAIAVLPLLGERESEKTAANPPGVEATPLSEIAVQDSALAAVEPAVPAPVEDAVIVPEVVEPEPRLAEATASPEAEAAAPERMPASEPILIAALDPVHYLAPEDALLRESPGDLVRGTSGGPALVAWVPDHVAHSATAQPTLYWELGGELEDGHEVSVVLTAENEPEPLYEGVHVIDAKRVRQETNLASLGVSLTPGEVYRWSVVVRAASGDPSADRIAQGWVEYRAPSRELVDRFAEARRGNRAAHYAERGYWYDALALLVEFEREHPGDADARERLVGFLAKAGITPVAR